MQEPGDVSFGDHRPERYCFPNRLAAAVPEPSFASNCWSDPRHTPDSRISGFGRGALPLWKLCEIQGWAEGGGMVSDFDAEEAELREKTKDTIPHRKVAM
jgi:hypothetical protein